MGGDWTNLFVRVDDVQDSVQAAARLYTVLRLQEIRAGGEGTPHPSPLTPLSSLLTSHISHLTSPFWLCVVLRTQRNSSMTPGCDVMDSSTRPRIAHLRSTD